jgi:diguanylate cyclase (GGDEF)-like protein
VLVAAEDPGVRELLASALAGRHEPIHADDAATALDAARAGRCDAAVLALTTRGADALATLERLRGEVATAELPALLLAGPAGEAARLRALELGADLLPATCSAPELAARLDRALHQARATAALRDEALTDPLTGLPNRRALECRLHEELRRARRYRTPLSCVMADLDHLKPINDLLGHAAGDQALQSMAAVLRAGLRETDFAARAGGDEFLLLLPHTSAQEAVVLAERLRRSLARVRLGAGRDATRVGASFGVAALGPDADGEAMVEAADRALLAAKRAGRGTVRRDGGPGRGVAAATPALGRRR